MFPRGINQKSRKMKKLVLIVTALFLVSTALVSCRDQNNTNDVENELRDERNDIEEAADDVSDAIDNAAEDTGDAIENAAEDTGDAIEEGWDEAKENTGIGGHDDM